MFSGFVDAQTMESQLPEEVSHVDEHSSQSRPLEHDDYPRTRARDDRPQAPERLYRRLGIDAL